MKVAIVQSNYIPWKGYFDLIRSVDHFVLFDSVQYTRRDWRNRNKIKTPQGAQWLTIPVKVKDKYDQLIRETEVSEADWGRKHWGSIKANYARAPFFARYKDLFEPLYLASTTFSLSEINRQFIEAVCVAIGIKTTMSWSWEHAQEVGRNETLASICQAVGGTEYVSGPAAQGYMDLDVFAKRGQTVSYFDYVGYPVYPQLHGPFDHAVSVLDLLFMTGPDALHYLDRVCK